MAFTPSSLRIGILGAGQLGKMLAQEASKLDIELHFLDKSKDYPAGKISRFFTEGDFKLYNDVLQFGKDLDVIGIEIEEVNIDALFELKNMGKTIIPDPEILKLIQDKGLQKVFYIKNGIPTAPFWIFDNLQSIHKALESNEISFPFVQKLRIGGYDGRGVTIVKTKDDLGKLLEGPSIVEKMADIHKELSVICISTSTTERLAYEVVEMEFNSDSNLVEYLLSPAQISLGTKEQAQQIALEICKLLEIQGLLAVEMFLNKDGSIWVNEIAPRPHNSGHHTLDNGSCSQFANQVRALAKLPAGQVESDKFAIMINLIGQEGYIGPVKYIGIEDCSKITGVNIHLYGKSETRPHRKMGHVCITDLNLDKCKEKANFVRQTILVIS
ncbi:MAG: 5-(carboxyamino)imidazole ribonucleotide synthase [Saprospiraceae bacterium]|nr:5-(carboxyamino)imidazole ribonucleotide synthase [Saprospiraceae bacterium]MBK9632492.1 5-(carboxyamino)imidazole ribonucleotide synthase [Saprospiraceae bacterium]